MISSDTPYWFAYRRAAVGRTFPAIRSEYRYSLAWRRLTTSQLRALKDGFDDAIADKPRLFP